MASETTDSDSGSGGGYEYFSVGGDRSLQSFKSTGEYDPGITKVINAAIRNMPMVRKHCDDMAQLLLVRAGAGTDLNFKVVKAGGPSRYRAYVVPADSDAVTAELDEAVLTKAALSMRGR